MTSNEHPYWITPHHRTQSAISHLRILDDLPGVPHELSDGNDARHDHSAEQDDEDAAEVGQSQLTASGVGRVLLGFFLKRERYSELVKPFWFPIRYGRYQVLK